MRKCFKVFVVLLVIAVFLELGMAFTHPRGGGGQISPSRLEYRERGAFHTPVLNIRVGWQDWESHRAELIQYLIDEGYWQESERVHDDWIHMYTATPRVRGGVSNLCQVLEMKDILLLEYTKKNSKRSERLWRLVIDLLRSGDVADQDKAEMLLDEFQYVFPFVPNADFEEWLNTVLKK